MRKEINLFLYFEIIDSMLFFFNREQVELINMKYNSCFSKGKRNEYKIDTIHTVGIK